MSKLRGGTALLGVLILVVIHETSIPLLLEFDIVPMSTITLLVFQGLDFFIYFDMLIRVKPRQ